MSIAMPLVRIPIGVVVERRKAVSLWCEFVCVGSPSLAGLPEANPWTQLATECGTMTFYAGPAEIELYRTETEKNYRSNLISASPSDWIMLLATASDPPYEISVLTVDPAEAEALTESAQGIIEAVAMPVSVHQVIASFITNIMSSGHSKSGSATVRTRKRWHGTIRHTEGSDE